MGVRQENIDELINKIVIYESQNGNINIEDEVNINRNINIENEININRNIHVEDGANIFEEDMESENMQASNKTLSAFW